MTVKHLNSNEILSQGTGHDGVVHLCGLTADDRTKDVRATSEEVCAKKASSRSAPATIRQLVTCLLLSCALGVSAGGIQRMTVEAAHAAAHDGSMFLVDIRTPSEWRESGVPDVATPLDMTAKNFLQELIALRGSDPTRKVGLICATGGRSRYLSRWLARNGMDGIVDVTAGVHGRDGWRVRKLPLRAPDAPAVISPDHPVQRSTTR